MMIELIQTLLPDPVVPAMSMWGILTRSSTIGSPLASLPRNIGRIMPSAAPELMSSRKRTFSRLGFGTSMPMVVLPAIVGTMRMFGAPRLRAKSLAMLLMRATRVPGASCTE